MRERMGKAARAISERNRGATERSLESHRCGPQRIREGKRRVTLAEFVLAPLSLIYGAVRIFARAPIAKAFSSRGVSMAQSSASAISPSEAPARLPWSSGSPSASPPKARALAFSLADIAAIRANHDHPTLQLQNASSGDEVRMLQSRLGDRVAFGVGADRYAKGVELAKRGVNWFVLDDGFQHLRLARDVDIVLIDATNPFGGGRLLPAGRLRESRSALARADIVVITRRDHAPAVEAADPPRNGCVDFLRAPEARCDPQLYRRSARWQCRSERAGSALCILRHWRSAGFPGRLARLGLEIVGDKFFPDHHRFTDADDEKSCARPRSRRHWPDLHRKGCLQFARHPLRQNANILLSISMHVDREDEFWNEVLATAKSRAEASQLKLQVRNDERRRKRRDC